MEIPARLFIGSDDPHTFYTFVDVISQIGLGYVFLFLVWGQSFATQLVIALAILAAYQTIVQAVSSEVLRARASGA